MKYVIMILCTLCLGNILRAQYVYTINADSVKITNHCDTAEFILENHTQNVPGFLYNKGRGRTEFRPVLQKINDSLFLVGADTLVIHQSVLKWYRESPLPAGANNYTVTGNYAMATGGQGHNVYGINSGIIGGVGNVAGGNNSYGIGDNSVVVGGFQNLDSCVDCVIASGDDNILHPSAVNSGMIGTARSEIYPFNSMIAAAPRSLIQGPTGNNGIGESIVGGSEDTVRGDGGSVLGGLYSTSYSFGETVSGLYATAYTPASSTGIVPTDRLFNIGNGTSLSNRSDAFTVFKNGNARINGGLYLPYSDTTGKSAIYKGGDVFMASWNGDPTYGANGFDNSVFLGRQTGNFTNHSIGFNTAVGYQALPKLTTGFNDNAIGVRSCNVLTTGWNNVGDGPYSLQLLTTGNENTAIGTATLWNLTTQSENTAVGCYAGGNDTGTLNVFLGFRAGLNETGSNKLYIANSGTANPLIYGDFSTGKLTFNGSAFITGKTFLGGNTTPTATAHFAAGTATAGTAPIKLTAGAVLTTPEDGAVEYDGTDLFFTQNTVRYKLSKTLTGQLTTSFGGATVTAGNTITASISVPGAQPGDVVAVSANTGAVNPPSVIITAYVTTADAVTLQAYNSSGSAVTLASDMYKVKVIR